MSLSEHEATLTELATELCSSAELEALEAVFTPEFDYHALIYLDLLIGGPGVATFEAAKLGPEDLIDRDIFRPLQYCCWYLSMFPGTSWLSRDVVYMGGFHLESLAKRVGGEWSRYVPLGRLVRDRQVERAVGGAAAEQLRRFALVHNAAKHELPTDDRHLFSQQDAVRAYVVSRKLAKTLYPHAKLTVALERFKIA